MKRGILLCIIAAYFLNPFKGSAAVQDEIAARNKQIEELQLQINEYQKQILETSGKAQTLSGEISRLNAQIGKIQLEVRSLSLAIGQTDSEITTTQKSIYETQAQMDIHKQALGQSLQALYQIDQQNLTQVLLRNSQISDFFNNVQNLDEVQNSLAVNIGALKILKMDLEQKQSSLQEKRSDLEELKALQESQRRTIDQNKGTKDKLLKQTKGDEAKYQSLVKQTRQQLDRIREQIYYLQQSGVTVEDAIKYGQLAAKTTGIRPAFLIAILDVESRLGKNVGTGNWNDDMYQCYIRLAQQYPSKRATYLKRAETEKAAFFSIINALGLDANTVKVSKEPSYGCGGAMGPAQFIASTWKGYEDRIREATGHAVPNPWNIQDAFMAAAIKLANDGATGKTPAAETRAAKSYLSGNANCNSSICNYYAKLALDKAAIIEQNL